MIMSHIGQETRFVLVMTVGVDKLTGYDIYGAGVASILAQLNLKHCTAHLRVIVELCHYDKLKNRSYPRPP